MSDAICPFSITVGDATAAMSAWPSGVFDAIVTDPPYGQTNEKYDGSRAASLRPEVWAECARVCKPDAALIAFSGGPTYHRIASAIEAGGWKVRQMWGWVYRDGMITSAYPKEGFDRLAPAMDPIVFATRGKVLLNVEREGDQTWHVARNTPKSLACISERSGGRRATTGTGRYPRTLVSDGTEPFAYFILPRCGKYRESDHPNEKPLDVMRWLIGKLPAKTILDPFAGAGTTLIAAGEMGRSAVGIELDEKYADMARKRIGRFMENSQAT